MRILLAIGCFLLGGALCAIAETVPLDANTETKLSDEAMMRYAEPGSVARYKKLIETLRQPLDDLGAPARELRLPIRSFPNGKPETTVLADEAWITLDTSYLRGRKVIVTQYREDGSIEAILNADEIAVDRNNMIAVVKGRLHGTMNEDTLDGVGALVDLEAKYVRIVKRAIIKTKRMGDVNLTDRGIF